MAMFDLKDTEDAKITGCHTDSSTLVKGDKVKRLEVADSSAFAQPLASPRKPKWRILEWVAKHVLASLLIAVLGGIIVAYCSFRFGWTK